MFVSRGTQLELDKFFCFNCGARIEKTSVKGFKISKSTSNPLLGTSIVKPNLIITQNTVSNFWFFNRTDVYLYSAFMIDIIAIAFLMILYDYSFLFVTQGFIP